MSISSPRKVSKGFLWISVGIGYYLWVQMTQLAIPCPFRLMTGLKCPGCGITTLLLCLGRGDWTGALQANAFLFLTAPLLLAEILYFQWRKTQPRPFPRWNQIALGVYIAGLCLFGVLRNLPIGP